jgi:diguanylate cyclase (GGDEF)-like protein/PAS domain S-box-containing protein
MAMNILVFMLGLLTGIFILLLYIQSTKAKSIRNIESENHVIELFEGSMDLIYHYQLKPEQKFTYVSSSIETMLGPGLVDKSYQNPLIPFDFIHPDDHDTLVGKLNGTIDYSKPILQRWRDHTGNYKWCEEYATPIYENGERVALVGIIRDVSEKVKLQQELQYLSTHDDFTGIYNRNYFERTMVRYNKEIDCPITIILCDLDELKAVNDTYGHAEGDFLIKESAKLIKGFFSENAIVARIGGDEIAIVLPDTDPSQVENLCSEFSENLTNFNRSSNDLQIELSMGYAFGEHSLGNMARLFAEADKNMYRNKNERKQKRGLLCR